MAVGDPTQERDGEEGFKVPTLVTGFELTVAEGKQRVGRLVVIDKY